MNQKELDIQRALGTLNVYWIEMSFPYMEETVPNLEQIISEFIPNSIRFYGNLTSTFMLEASPTHLKKLLEKLPDKLQPDIPLPRNTFRWITITVFEDQDSGRIPIENFTIPLHKEDEST